MMGRAVDAIRPRRSQDEQRRPQIEPTPAFMGVERSLPGGAGKCTSRGGPCGGLAPRSALPEIAARLLAARGFIDAAQSF